jgi:small GTP-binding protein
MGNSQSGKKPTTQSDGASSLKLKIIIVGSGRAGKTSIVQRFANNVFNEDVAITVGVEFAQKSLDVEGQYVTLQLWDTAHEEKFRRIIHGYFRGVKGVILVFDLTDRNSFNGLDEWLTEVSALCDPTAARILVGNKLDLTGRRKVTRDEAETFAKLHQLLYFETSARSGENIQEAFYGIAALNLGIWSPPQKSQGEDEKISTPASPVRLQKVQPESDLHVALG